MFEIEIVYNPKIIVVQVPKLGFILPAELLSHIPFVSNVHPQIKQAHAYTEQVSTTPRLRTPTDQTGSRLHRTSVYNTTFTYTHRSNRLTPTPVSYTHLDVYKRQLINVRDLFTTRPWRRKVPRHINKYIMTLLCDQSTKIVLLRFIDKL